MRHNRTRRGVEVLFEIEKQNRRLSRIYGTPQNARALQQVSIPSRAAAASGLKCTVLVRLTAVNEISALD